MTTPRDQAETIIISIWEELLEVEIEPSDNVFDRGAFSLMVVDVVAKARRAGLELKAADVFQHPAPADLADHLRSPEEPPAIHDMVETVWRQSMSPWDERVPPSLVSLVPEGEKEPLFCVHLGTGHIRLITDLARAGGNGRPVFGFEAIGYRAPVRPLLSIGEIADRYLRELRVAQPDGPYHLAGLCSGAVVALEMAQRLHASGADVAALIMVDPPWGMPERDPGWGLTDNFDYLIGMLRARFGLRDHHADLPRVLRELKDRKWFEEGVRAEDFYRLTVLWAAAEFAQEHYEPRRYDGPVAIVSATEHGADVRRYWLPFMSRAELNLTDENTTTDIVMAASVADVFRKVLR